MHGLTSRQLKAFEYIRAHTEQVGYAPTLRELCDYMGYKAVGSAQDVIACLRRKGFISTPSKQVARSLTLTDKGRALYLAKNPHSMDTQDTFTIPCLGAVPAGSPLEAVEENRGFLSVSRALLPRNTMRKNLFALKTIGLSMIDAGILDGDWLIVQQQKEAQQGAIVVARIKEEATVKRLCQDPKRGWYLKPENPDFDNIYADETRFSILGRVIALQRTFSDLLA